MVTRGVPAHRRSYNGPQMNAKVVHDWLAKAGVSTLYIEPGLPWENGLDERFSGKLRTELLHGEIFNTVHEAKVLIERWRRYATLERIAAARDTLAKVRMLHSSLTMDPSTLHTAPPLDSLRLSGALTRPFSLIRRHRHLLIQTSITDVRARVAASTLGWIWVALYPLLFLGAYAMIYVYVFKVRFPGMGGPDYVLFIFCGLVPFLWFSESVSLGTNSVVTNPTLIKNTMFPIDLVPAKNVVASQATYLVGMAMIMTVLAISGRLTPWALLWPIVWCLQFMFLAGVVWLTAAICVFLRDLQQLIGVGILLLMMVSPIAYPPETVPDGLRPFLSVNPLHWMISTYQDMLIRGTFPSSLLVFAAISVLTFLLGHLVFTRLKGVFADYV